MDPARIRALLDRVRKGELSVEVALDELRKLPFRELGFATVDHHRHLRRGFPEVVFGLGKTPEQIVAILSELARGGGNCLVTRVDAAAAQVICQGVPGTRYEAGARACVLEQAPLTARLMGNRVERLFDVGVAGIHRLLGRHDALDAAEVIIVCAGMEGALPSVVGGLVARPVIAVPTSVGYGASFGGIAALLAMLNSCASNVTVVNIDNGFGAAYTATLIARASESPR